MLTRSQARAEEERELERARSAVLGQPELLRKIVTFLPNYDERPMTYRMRLVCKQLREVLDSTIKTAFYYQPESSRYGTEYILEKEVSLS
jgi:hypothetical protein